MNISDEKKVEILLAVLNERYESLHKIRERVQNTGVWFMGILFGIAGWLLQGEKLFSCSEKLLLIGGLATGYFVFQKVFLADLRQGFKSQQRAAVSIESKLCLYDNGAYSDDNTSVYPENWKKSGTENGDGKFFNTVHALILTGVCFLAIAILMSGNPLEDYHSQKIRTIHYGNFQ